MTEDHGKILKSNLLALDQERIKLAKAAITPQLGEAIRTATQTLALGNQSGLGNILEYARKPIIPPMALSIISEWEKTGKALNESIGRLANALQGMDWKPVFSFFAEVAEQGRKTRLVEQSGWLPHQTTPFHLLEGDNLESADRQDIGAIIGGYYLENWSSVDAAFREQIAQYDIDDEAKETFREALSIHGAGHYRAAPRLLFPEIERVASEEFFEGKRRIPKPNGKGKVPITRLEEVRETAQDLPAGDIYGYEYGMELFRKLEEHLYEEIGDDQEVRARFAADPVPNRHGALHGIVPYRTMQTSLNAIIMADFLFHVVSRIKLRMRKSDPGGEGN
jgi:hypothetical protein